MAWPSVKKSVETFCRRALAAVVCSKQTPSHIGFIMDGNRRYAQQFGMETALGHSMGYSVLLDCLQWCLELDIAVVSVYAFSIDNYNRSENEVDTLMVLAERKLLELSCEAEKLAERGVRVNVLGDLTLAPERVQVAAAHVADATKHNSKCTLNICFSYTYVIGVSLYLYLWRSLTALVGVQVFARDCPSVSYGVAISTN
jgi:ditrans,polycis-polyprenyl diphosphate synthase